MTISDINSFRTMRAAQRIEGRPQSRWQAFVNRWADRLLGS